MFKILILDALLTRFVGLIAFDVKNRLYLFGFDLVVA